MKVKFVLILAAAALASTSCARDEYGGFRKALRHQCQMMDEFTIAVAAASGPEDIAAALKKFQKEAAAGRERMLKLATEHPGLADRDKANLPEDVRADLARIEEVTPRFVDALGRVDEEYGRVPEVRKAMNEMGSVISLPPR